ncbi:MAG: alpha/beta hydrolase family protein [Glycocaulis sp.]
MVRGILAAFIVMALCSAAQARDERFAGIWHGTLDVGAAQLRMGLHVDAADGELSAVMVSVDQGGARIPVSTLTIEGDTLDARMAAVGARYAAMLEDDRLSGTFHQGGAEFPLEMARGAFEAAGPQLAPGEREVFVDAGVRLAATLRLPEGDGPHPAVLMLNGSGSQDRDVTIGNHRIFAVLAEAYAQAGIASLRLDDRGMGGSDATPPSGPRELGADASAALAFLRVQDGINGQCVGISGHSEGGIIAFLTPADSQPDFILMLAGQAGTLEETLLEQGEVMNRAMGAGDDVVEATRARQIAMLEALRGSPPGEAVEAVEAAFIAHGIPAEAACQQAQFWGQRYVQEAAALDPAAAMASFDGPVTAVFAGKDLQVLPEINTGRVLAAREGLATRTLTLDGVTHLFQASETGLPNEYATAPHAMAPDALAAIAGEAAALLTMACPSAR